MLFYGSRNLFPAAVERCKTALFHPCHFGHDFAFFHEKKENTGGFSYTGLSGFPCRLEMIRSACRKVSGNSSLHFPGTVVNGKAGVKPPFKCSLYLFRTKRTMEVTEMTRITPPVTKLANRKVSNSAPVLFHSGWFSVFYRSVRIHPGHAGCHAVAGRLQCPVP